jgi:hypothetical protein
MVPPHSKQLYRPPPHGFEHDPRWIKWRLDHVQDITQDHHDRLTALEQRPHLSTELIDRIPWARLITVLAAWVLFTTGLLTKAQLLKLWFGL